MNIKEYMSWIGGVDLMAKTPGAAQPNVVVHIGKVVTTPLGSAPAGLVFYQPDPLAPPAFFGFVCPDPALGAYFGPKIFAGTPFENAPNLTAKITVTENGATVSSVVEIEGFRIETTLSQLAPLRAIDRPFGAPMPFRQQGIEAAAGAATLKINGVEIELELPAYSHELGGTGVWAPVGVYSR